MFFFPVAMLVYWKVCPCVHIKTKTAMAPFYWIHTFFLKKTTHFHKETCATRKLVPWCFPTLRLKTRALQYTWRTQTPHYDTGMMVTSFGVHHPSISATAWYNSAKSNQPLLNHQNVVILNGYTIIFGIHISNQFTNQKSSAILEPFP